MNYKMERYVGDAYCRAFHEATAIINDFFENDKLDDRKSLIDVLNAVVEIFSGKLDMQVVNSFTNDEILGYLGALIKSIAMGYRFCNNPCEEEFDKIIDNIVKDKLFIMTPYIFNGAYHQWGHKAYDRLKDKVPEELRWNFFKNMYKSTGFQFPTEWVFEAIKWRPANYLECLPNEYKNSEKIVIYRASVSPPHLMQFGDIRRELSWSTNPNVVKRFFHIKRSVDGHAYLYQGEIAAKDILCYFSEIEDELVQYDSVRNIRYISDFELQRACDRYNSFQNVKGILDALSAL